mgnify:FL=1
MNNLNTITIKIDEDNDIYEMTVNNVVYTLDNVYDSEYGDLFDELNMAIEILDDSDQSDQDDEWQLHHESNGYV